MADKVSKGELPALWYCDRCDAITVQKVERNKTYRDLCNRLVHLRKCRVCDRLNETIEISKGEFELYNEMRNNIKATLKTLELHEASEGSRGR